jgi:hypothetical protein
MAFNRQVIERQLVAHPPISLAFAIPDHPWVDASDGAAVRIAMTVGKSAEEGKEGTLVTVTSEHEGDGEGLEVELFTRRSVIHADLTGGANVAGSLSLNSNAGISFMGMIPLGAGFWIDEQMAVNLGRGRVPGLDAHIRRYRNGKDLTDKPRGIFALDFYGVSENELRLLYPEAYQWVLERVKPQRDQDKRPSRSKNWWFFAESVPKFRFAVVGLTRYIGTAETAKHRMFVFLDADILPDQKIRTITSDDAYILGVLSSRLHVVWALAAGGTLENRPVYNNTRCFEPFPFPATSDEQKQTIRALAEQLDAHRKRQQALYPDLTLTGMYNVLEKLREIEKCRGGIYDALGSTETTPGTTETTPGAMNRAPTIILTAKEKTIHEQGLVAILKQLHDELDAAVFAAYGWPATLSDAEILEKVVALNRERAREEEQGLIRWLRPEYQQPHGAQVTIQDDLNLGETEAAPLKIKAKLLWPKTLPEQVQAVRAALANAAAPITAETLARTFQRARADKVGELLETLAALGQVREVEKGSFVG